ncbi:hypothetical protein MJO28_003416 [Puccinia striiformis f. sp. tritici]|nr:hypothetical protein MJO28_003416 [Puccinia striiformis f. sp. tritici]KNE90383.1 hypothetical protein PSTG_16176 [Puccinia striiformis f. sp. tritici PST-78]
MGGRFFPNHVEFINQSITNWISGDYYQGILAKSEAEHKAMEQEAEQLREQKAVQAAEKQRDAKIAKEMKMDAKRFSMVSKQKEDEKARKAVAAHKKQERQKKAGTTDQLKDLTTIKKRAREGSAEEDNAEKSPRRSARTKVVGLEEGRVGKEAREATEKRDRKAAIVFKKERAQTHRDVRERQAEKIAKKKQGDVLAMEGFKASTSTDPTV